MTTDDLGSAPRAASSFSASEAAFAGLRMLVREPRTWLIWGAALLAFFFAAAVLTVTAVGPALVRFQALQAQQQPDPAAVLSAMGGLAPFYLMTMSASLLFYAIAFAAVNRALLRPGPSRSAHLAVGRDELRQLGVLVLLFLVVLAVYFAAVIGVVVVGVAAALASAAAHVGGAAGGAGGAAGAAVLIGVGLALAVMAVFAFVLTRLSLTSPLAFDTGRIDLRASWRLTRGRFWPLFGAYVLTWFTSFAIFAAAGVLFTALGVAIGGGVGGVAGLFRPDMSSLAAYFGPVRILHTVLSAALAPMVLALTLGAPAGAYAQLRALEGVPGSAAPATPGSDLPRFGR